MHVSQPHGARAACGMVYGAYWCGPGGPALRARKRKGAANGSGWCDVSDVRGRGTAAAGLPHVRLSSSCVMWPCDCACKPLALSLIC
eukprot:scaffold3777_cov123-Isochrysis_galbana.AAC.11